MHAVVREDDHRRVADPLGEVGTELGAVDLAGVLVDEARSSSNIDAGLVHELGQLADRREQADVVRVVVHDDAGVGAPLVQLGVDVDRRRDVPAAVDHLAVGVDGADVGRRAPRPTTGPTGSPTCSPRRRAAR